MHPTVTLSARSRRLAAFAAHLAVAVAALVLLLSGLAGVARAATSGSWTDPAGDAPSGVPDIRGVDLVRDDATFRWTITAPDATRLTAGTYVWISLRADDDAHLIEIDATENRITHYDWDGAEWTFRRVDVLTATGTYPLQVAIDRAALGDPTVVHFTVTTARYDAVASQPWSSDTTDVLTLDLAATPGAGARRAGCSRRAGRPDRARGRRRPLRACRRPRAFRARPCRAERPACLRAPTARPASRASRPACPSSPAASAARPPLRRARSSGSAAPPSPAAAPSPPSA